VNRLKAIAPVALYGTRHFQPTPQNSDTKSVVTNAINVRNDNSFYLGLQLSQIITASIKGKYPKRQGKMNYCLKAGALWRGKSNIRCSDFWED
jgi:hypothetical protein